MLDSEIKILFVDDDKDLLSDLKRTLYSISPYQNFFTANINEAFNFIKNNDIKIVVSNLKMPDMDGLSFLKQVKKINPDIICIILSGHTEISILLDSINSGEIFRFLTKPFNLQEEFMPAINQAVEVFKLKRKNQELQQELQEKNIKLANTNLILEEQVNKRTQELKLALKTVNQELEIRSNFIANLSHEIRTPLTIINGILEHLNNTKEAKQELYPLYSLLEENSERLIKICKKLLKFTEIKTRESKLVFKNFNLKEILDSIHKSSLSKLKNSNISFNISCLPLNKCFLIGDIELVTLLINEVIDNAIKFTKSGEISLSVSTEDTKDPQSTFLIFKISNTGEIIPEEKVNNIFNDFVQGESSLTRNTRGLGLGLGLAKYITQIMHGKINYLFDETQGNTFLVKIKLKKCL